MNEKFREARRFLLERPAVLIDPSTRFKVGSLVLDLSLTGASLELPPGIKLPKIVDLRWEPLTGAPPLVLKCELVWQKAARAGVRFQNMPPKTRTLLDRFLNIRFAD